MELIKHAALAVAAVAASWLAPLAAILVLCLYFPANAYLFSGYPRVLGVELSTTYLSGVVAPGATVATVSVRTSGQTWAGTLALSGAAAADFTLSGSTLVAAVLLTPGTPYDISILATPADSHIAPVRQDVEIYGGLTYYISPTGSDANSGLSAAAPWLTPFHTPH